MNKHIKCNAKFGRCLTSFSVAISIFLTATNVFSQTARKQVDLQSCDNTIFNNANLVIPINTSEGNTTTASLKNSMGVLPKTNNGEFRLITTGSDPIYLKFPSSTTEVKVEEIERNSAIKDQIEFVFKTIAALDTSENKRRKEPEKCGILIPTFPRSNITLAVLAEATKPEAQTNNNANKNQSTDKNLAASLKLVVGPREPWYLTGDVPITNIKLLEKSNGQLALKEKPASFYLGVNYRFTGDYLTGYQPFDAKRLTSLTDNVSGKFLFKASAKPSESMGLGLSYKMALGEVFIARMRTMNKDEDGTALGGNTYGWGFGVSFDLAGNLPNWLK